MTLEQPQKKYPDAMTIKFPERGYTFLHRVFRKNVDSGKPVIINTGKLYFQYEYAPGHTTFEQGISLVDGDPNNVTHERFMSTVRGFGLDTAISEGRYRKHSDGRLTK